MGRLAGRQAGGRAERRAEGQVGKPSLALRTRAHLVQHVGADLHLGAAVTMCLPLRTLLKVLLDGAASRTKNRAWMTVAPGAGGQAHPLGDQAKGQAAKQ